LAGHDNIIYAAVECLAVFCRLPTAQLLAVNVEFKEGAMLPVMRAEMSSVS